MVLYRQNIVAAAAQAPKINLGARVRLCTFTQSPAPRRSALVRIHKTNEFEIDGTHAPNH